MSERNPVPLFARVILAPLYWPKLLLGSRFLPVEEGIFDAMLSALPIDSRSTVESQLREVNYVTRSSIEHTEVVLQKVRIFAGGTLRRKRVLPNDDEMMIASADVTFSVPPNAHAEVWSVQGVVFMLKFDRVVDLRRMPRSVTCTINPAITAVG